MICFMVKCFTFIYTCTNVLYLVTPAVECVRLIIGSFCWVDYLANKGFCTSLPATLSRYRMRFDVFSVRTVVNVPLFIRNPYMFLMTSRYSESLFIGTFV